MIKVLQVTGVMNRGGAEVMLMDVLRNLPPDIHFDFLVNNHPANLNEKGSFDDEIIERGCQIMHIGSQLRLGPRQYIKEFKNIVQQLNPDIVHIHLNAKNGLIALAAHLAHVKRIISHCHADIKFHGSLFSKLRNETEVWVQKWLIGWYATDYWGCSIQANKCLYRSKHLRKSIIINNAIDCSSYENINADCSQLVRSQYGVYATSIVLGNVGRIVPHKGIAKMLDVVVELVNRGIDAHFVIVGRNDTPEYVDSIIARAKDLKLLDRIHFIGERADIPMVMHSFNVFVGSSLSEGFGLVAIEAQAAAVPCVLYKGFPASVDMKVGLCTFIDNFDPDCWADAIETHLSHKPIDKSIALEAIKQLGFDAKTNAQKICSFYKS